MTQMTQLRSSRAQGMHALAGYLPALCRWQVQSAGMAVAWLLVWWRAGDATTPGAAAWLVRTVAAVASLTVVFAIDDPSVDATRSLAATRRVAMGLRFTVIAIVAGACLTPSIVVAWDPLDSTSIVGALLVEVAAVLALTIAVALVLQRRLGIREPAQYVVLALLLVLMFGQFAAARWPLFVEPGSQWAAAHWRWGAILVVSAAAASWQLRDPASAPFRRWLRSAS